MVLIVTVPLVGFVTMVTDARSRVPSLSVSLLGTLIVIVGLYIGQKKTRSKLVTSLENP